MAVELAPTIRPVATGDEDAVLRLFESGALGEDRPSDPGDDVRDLAGVYLGDGAPMLWVAELGGHGVVGMVSVWSIEEDVAELRRLRVSPDHQGRGVGKALVGHALAYCRDANVLKVVLDTFVERSGAIALFEQFGFKLARTKHEDGREKHDFYLDLYREVRPD